MVRTKRCVVCRRVSSETVSIFKFPQDHAIAAQWATFCGISPEAVNSTTFLCTVHFTADCFKRNFKKDARGVQLKSGVIPTLNRDGPAAETNVGQECAIDSASQGNAANNVDESRHGDVGQSHCDGTTEMKNNETDPSRGRITIRVRRRFCCICGSIETGNVFLHFYRFPRNAERRAEWLHSLELMESELKDWFRVCSRHFIEGISTGVPVRPSINDHDPDIEAIDIHSSSVPGLTSQMQIDGVSAKRPANSDDDINNESVGPLDNVPLLDIDITGIRSPSLQDVTSEVEIVGIPHSSSGRNEQFPVGDVTVAHIASDVDPLCTPGLPGAQPTDQEHQCSRFTGSTPKSSKRKFRYFHDFSTPDLQTPRRKRRCLNLGKSQLSKYRMRIDSLARENIRMQKRLTKIEDALTTLQRRGMISECAVETLKVLSSIK